MYVGIHDRLLLETNTDVNGGPHIVVGAPYPEFEQNLGPKEGKCRCVDNPNLKPEH